jgi:RNA polymerase sigma factor for flagellar operon FliA
MGRELESFEKDRGSARQFETYSMEVVSEEVMNIREQESRQPDALVEESQMMNALTEAIDGLPERDKLVISLYYVEELNLREIGEVLGVSESRVSQILSANVKKLRTQLQH